MKTWRHKITETIHLNSAAKLSNIPGPPLTIYISWWCLSPYATALLGILERTIYVIAFLAGQLVVVGFWLGIKLAAGLKSWNEPHGRTAFNVWLIGNLLSIIFSFAAALSIKIIGIGPFLEWKNIYPALPPIILTFLILIWIPIDKKWAKYIPPIGGSGNTKYYRRKHCQ